MLRLSLIVPAYNEEKRIEAAIKSYIRSFSAEFGRNFEIIVVLNGCRDRTAEIIERMKKRSKIIRAVEHKEAIGKGGAIAEGMKLSKGNVIGFVDADDAFETKAIIRLAKMVEEGSECAIASKWKDKSFNEVSEPFTRKVMSRGWNMLVWSLLSLNYKDTQAGAKFFSRKVLKAIDTEFICRDFSFDAELLSKIKSKGFRITEVYVPSRHMEGSTFRLSHSKRMFRSLIKFWWSK